MTFKERIAERQKIRAEIAESERYWDKWNGTLLLISESIDDYIESRVEADKVLEGILTDIQANTATIAQTRMETIISENVN